jgi:hypothetical protein
MHTAFSPAGGARIAPGTRLDPTAGMPAHAAPCLRA